MRVLQGDDASKAQEEGKERKKEVTERRLRDFHYITVFFRHRAQHYYPCQVSLG